MEVVKAKHKKSREEVMELIVVIMLGITALLTAWACWIGSLHGGNQATNYATSNNLAAEGNSEYNAGIQDFMQDSIIYNEYNALLIEHSFAADKGNQDVIDQLEWKISEIENKSMTPELYEATQWALEQEKSGGEYVSPFDKEGFTDTYYASANDLIAQSEKALEQGKKDNQNGDSFGLVTVVYSVVLFLLGISGTFKSNTNKTAVVLISCAALIIATVYMLTIPMPTGFSLTSYMSGGT